MTKVYNETFITQTDFARQKFIDKGLDYCDISEADFYRLVSMVCEELDKISKDTNFQGIHTMKISKRLKQNVPTFYEDSNGKMERAFIKVDSHYFEGREAITFNQNGWIGFAGWADSNNVTPFVNAFNRWVEDMRGIKCTD